MPLLPNQRALFDLPDDIAYLRCAATSPLLHRARKAGERAVGLKARPWGPGWGEQGAAAVERARELFAGLIGASAGDIALVPSASYGLSTAANNLPVGEHRSVVVLANQFPSNIYPWRHAVQRDGGEIRTVAPVAGDWTGPVIDAIDTNTAIVALPQCHWLDGAMLDLAAVRARCRDVEAALVLDLSQSAGVVPIDVRAIDPDFAVTVAEKWLLGPVQLGFLYVSPRWQTGKPIEHSWIGRRIGDARFLHHYSDDYRDGARRFDVGERTNIVNLSMAIEALQQITEWGLEVIAPSINPLIEAVAENAAAHGYVVSPDGARAPHIVGLLHPRGWPSDVQQRLERDSVLVSLRDDVLRIAPHVYNNEADVDALMRTLRKLMG